MRGEREGWEGGDGGGRGMSGAAVLACSFFFTIWSYWYERV